MVCKMALRNVFLKVHVAVSCVDLSLINLSTKIIHCDFGLKSWFISRTSGSWSKGSLSELPALSSAEYFSFTTQHIITNRFCLYNNVFPFAFKVSKICTTLKVAACANRVSSSLGFRIKFYTYHFALSFPAVSFSTFIFLVLVKSAILFFCKVICSKTTKM